MKHLKRSLIATILVAATTVAQAQVISIGTTKGGAVAQIGAAVSSAVSSKSGIQMRPQKMSGTQQYLSSVESGKTDFGVSNVMQYYMASTGTGLSKGKAHKKLRLVATLVPFTQGIIVHNNSDIKTVADLSGKRIPVGYGSSPLFQNFWEGFLANEGLSYKDVTPIPVASLPKSWGAFKQGQLDAVIAAAGSGAVREMNVVIDGGIRYIPIKDTESLRAALPKTRINTVEPAKHLVGIIEPTTLHSYEVVVFVNADVDDTVVYEVVKAISNSSKELKASSGLWNGYKPENIAMDHQMEYHHGALKYYTENNLIAK